MQGLHALLAGPAPDAGGAQSQRHHAGQLPAGLASLLRVAPVRPAELHAGGRLSVTSQAGAWQHGTGMLTLTRRAQITLRSVLAPSLNDSALCSSRDCPLSDCDIWHLSLPRDLLAAVQARLH